MNLSILLCKERAGPAGGATVSAGAGSEVEEDKDAREEEMDSTGDCSEQTLSGFFGWGLLFPGDEA